MTMKFSQLPKKTRFVILILALIAIGAFWYMAFRTAGSQPDPGNDGNAPQGAAAEADWSRAGVIVIDNPGLEQGIPYIIFEEPGSPALAKKLVFDGDSRCAMPAGEMPCLAISAPIEAAYGEERILVEGVSQTDGSLLVRSVTLEK
jgi:hypothetical protein